MFTCAACTEISVDYLRKFDHNKLFQHHDSFGELKDCAEADPSCGICLLLWRTVDGVTRLDISKPAVRDNLNEVYGLYGDFYDDTEPDYGLHDMSNTVTSRGSAVKIESRFLTYNFGLSRPGICLFALENTPAAMHFTERCTYADQTPNLSMQLGRKWLEICREHHHRFCTSAAPIGAVTMPTRIIALGSPNSASNAPTRLIAAGNLREPYVALSYCWGIGATESLMLRDENLESMKQFIDEGELLKTYREAFQVARELGFRFIWIDALCIIQENKSDWEHESARMSEVYGNADLTIVAARSGDSKSGFLQNSFKPMVPPCPFQYGRYDETGREIEGLYVGLDRTEFKTTFDPDPVQLRGWCLQEAELSKRLLVFSRDGVYFSCKTTKLYEDRVWTFFHHRDVQPKGVVVPRGLPDTNRFELLDHWYAAILPGYTARALTNPGDVFAAIASLAIMASLTIGGRYLAGVWESDLPRGLLWKPRYQIRWMVEPLRYEKTLAALRRPARSQAPSWSWAAVNGPVQHGWDNKKKWPPYPVEGRPSAFLVRPASHDFTQWTAQDDCDAHVLHMPLCELQMYGRPRRLRCTSTPQARLLDWYETLGYRRRQRPDDLPPQARGTILFEPATVLNDSDLSLLKEACPFDQIVAYGIFDIAEERIEEFWALPITRNLGLILDRNADGTFHRLGIFRIMSYEGDSMSYEWFSAGAEELVRLV
ncbi:heterokaryon incompatibility protein-domain-containing protein [Bisporella sp. PMI_857]|nr:heterokaryon incompatibility protein-domain-containing protein [Bisporella sp. PMI_857]